MDNLHGLLSAMMARTIQTANALADAQEFRRLDDVRRAQTRLNKLGHASNQAILSTYSLGTVPSDRADRTAQLIDTYVDYSDPATF